MNYVPPPVERLQSDSISTAEMDNLVVQWKERMMFIFEDLNWLLKLPHDLFWCQVTMLSFTVYLNLSWREDHQRQICPLAAFSSLLLESLCDLD